MLKRNMCDEWLLGPVPRTSWSCVAWCLLYLSVQGYCAYNATVPNMEGIAAPFVSFLYRCWLSHWFLGKSESFGRQYCYLVYILLEPLCVQWVMEPAEKPVTEVLHCVQLQHHLAVIFPNVFSSCFSLHFILGLLHRIGSSDLED
jgi:hypothetical protein